MLIRVFYNLEVFFHYVHYQHFVIYRCIFCWSSRVPTLILWKYELLYFRQSQPGPLIQNIFPTDEMPRSTIYQYARYLFSPSSRSKSFVGLLFPWPPEAYQHGRGRLPQCIYFWFLDSVYSSATQWRRIVVWGGQRMPSSPRFGYVNSRTYTGSFYPQAGLASWSSFYAWSVKPKGSFKQIVWSQLCLCSFQ